MELSCSAAQCHRGQGEFPVEAQVAARQRCEGEFRRSNTVSGRVIGERGFRPPSVVLDGPSSIYFVSSGMRQTTDLVSALQQYLKGDPQAHSGRVEVEVGQGDEDVVGALEIVSPVTAQCAPHWAGIATLRHLLGLEGLMSFHQSMMEGVEWKVNPGVTTHRTLGARAQPSAASTVSRVWCSAAATPSWWTRG